MNGNPYPLMIGTSAVSRAESSRLRTHDGKSILRWESRVDGKGRVERSRNDEE